MNNYVSDRPLLTPRVGTSVFWSSIQTHPTQAQHALDAGMERAAQSTVRRLGRTPVGRFASFATAPVDPIAKRALDTGTRVPSFQGTGTPSFYRPGDMFRRPGDMFRPVPPNSAKPKGAGQFVARPVAEHQKGAGKGVVSNTGGRLPEPGRLSAQGARGVPGTTGVFGNSGVVSHGYGPPETRGTVGQYGSGYPRPGRTEHPAHLSSEGTAAGEFPRPTQKGRLAWEESLHKTPANDPPKESARGSAPGEALRRFPPNPNSYAAPTREKVTQIGEEIAEAQRRYEQAGEEMARLNKIWEKAGADPTKGGVAPEETARVLKVFAETKAHLESVKSTAKGRVWEVIAPQNPMRSIKRPVVVLDSWGNIKKDAQGKEISAEAFGDSRDAKVQEGFDFVKRMVSRKAAPSVKSVNLARGVDTGRQRFAEGYDPENKIVLLLPNSTAGIVAHELGHWLEHRSPSVQAKAVAFYERRTRGEKSEKLGVGYKPHEMTCRDSFLDWYMGKDMVSHSGKRSTELVSMGLQMLYEDPITLAQQDPDYFDFLMDVLHGPE